MASVPLSTGLNWKSGFFDAALAPSRMIFCDNTPLPGQNGRAEGQNVPVMGVKKVPAGLWGMLFYFHFFFTFRASPLTGPKKV